MSYIKTNWVDNTTPIDSTNMNKIEQGIYDNSLVADAVNNVVKPNDETYKDVEITEGQITDVLGVDDVLIKGDTEQDGTPTPDSPVDVNVVSGSNVISTSNKNLANMASFKENYSLDDNGLPTPYNTTIRLTNVTPINVSNYNNVKVSYVNNTQSSISFIYSTLDENNTKIARVAGNLSGATINVANARYLYICFYDNVTLNSISNVQIEGGSTATTYEKHQGKELPLDLPVENLSPTSFVSTVNGGYINSSVGTFGNVIAGQTYVLSFKNNSNYTSSIGIRILYDDTYEGLESKNLVVNSRMIYIFTPSHSGTVSLSGKVTNDMSNIFTEIQLEKGSKANAYTPYGTTPIELCKIGDYQDYFYKENNKWYLHKETKKRIFDGSEDWNLREDDGTNYCYSVGNVTDYKHGNLDNYGFSNYFDVGMGIGFHDALLRGIGLRFYSESGSNVIYLVTNTSTTSSDLKIWLNSNNVVLYYILASATNTEITDTTLISQLEAIYNAPLYEQTNITQTNNDLPIILDITAFKDNINGIKAFIRK